MALFFLAAVAAVGEDRRRVAAVGTGGARAGSIACFSAPGLVWIAVVAALAALLVQPRAPIRRRVVWARWRAWSRWRHCWPPIPTGFFTAARAASCLAAASGPGGNFRGELNPAGGAGRLAQPRLPGRALRTAWVAALAVGVVAAAAGLWAVAAARATAAGRRPARWPSRSRSAADLVTIPYMSAKALVVAAPLLDGRGPGRAVRHRPRRTRGRGGVGARLRVFVALAAHSSLLALRGAAVTPPTAGAELEAFQPIVRGQPTLFLGKEPYAAWYLRDSQLSTVPWAAPVGAAGTVDPRTGQAAPRRRARRLRHPARPAALRRARYVVAPRTGFASRPPEDFKLVRPARRYLLFRREAPHRPRVRASGRPHPRGGPGAARGVPTKAPGVASVIAPPVVAGPRHWRFLHGAPLQLEGTEGVLPPTYAARVRLKLPAGRWSVSLAYRARFDTGARLDGRRLTLPAFLGDRFAPLELGEVNGGREVEVEVTGAYRSGGVANQASFVGAVTATRVGARPRLIPLRAACGRYVDWYRVGRG